MNRIRKLVIRRIAATLLVLLVIVAALVTVNHMYGSPDEDKVRSLSGQWEFYWEELLEPQDFTTGNYKPSSITVPGSWKNQLAGRERLSSTGYATYRTVFDIPADQIGTQQALSLHYVGSAYRIWINGIEHDGLGTVGTSRDEEVPQLQEHVILFSPAEEQIEIVMQVSNFSFREGGITSEIRVGDATSVARAMLTSTFITLIEIGAALLFGVYHLVLYYIRRTDIALLYIGLISLFYAIRTLLIAEYVTNMFFPLFPWEAVIKTEYLIEIGMGLLLGYFLRHMFPGDSNHTLFRVFVIIAVAALVYVAVTPTEIFTSLIHTVFVIALLLAIILEITVKVKLRNREDANLYLAGVLILLLAITNDTLNYAWVIHTVFLFKYAFMLFMVIQAIIVSNRYHRIHVHNARLTKELLSLNSTLEQKIEERTEELRDKNIELEELQQTRTKMLANIAHDIGTPLAGVKTFLQILKEDRIQVDRLQVFEKLFEKLSYIQHLNQDLLELSMLESRQLSLDREKIKISEFLHEIARVFQADMTGQNAKVVLGQRDSHIHGEEAYIEIDRQRIMQVIQNIVSNAYKYNQSAEKLLIIHCSIRTTDEHQTTYEAVFECEDNGEGIDPADLPHIFEQFYRRVDGYVDGSGLGLAIVKEIIEQHGGSVGARNKQEAGAVITFTLPASSTAQSLHYDS